MANVPQKRRREIVVADIGGWISGPALRDPRLGLSDGVPVGTACPLIGSGACRSRRTRAVGDGA